MTTDGKKQWLHYGLALLLCMVVFVLSIPAADGARLPPTLLFLAVIAFTSWSGGLGPGLLATAVGLAADLYLELVVVPSTGLSHLDAARLIVFIPVALCITWLNGSLRRTQHELTTLVAASPQPIIAIDLEGRVRTWNRAAERMLGWTAAEVLGRPPPLVPNLVDGARKRMITKTVDGPGVQGVEVRRQRKDGSMIDFQVSTAPLHGLRGETQGIVGIYTDITERKRADEALRASAEFNRAVIASTREGIVVFDHHLRHLLWNPCMEKLTGLRAEEVQGKCSVELFPHLREQEIDTMLHRALAGETVQSGDVPFHVPSTGKSGWVSSSYGPLHDAQGKITGVIGTITDITERKDAEEALSTQADTLRAHADLLDLAYDAIFVRDMEGSRIRFWSRGAERMYGWSKDEALGQTSYKLLHTQFPHSLDAIEAEMLRSARWEGELRHTAKDGSQIVVASRWALQRSAQGEPTGILEINSDITEHKHFEERLQHQALHDALTGLPNRTLLQERLQHDLLAAQRNGTPCALLLIDLDRFKEVNDVLGHAYGDLLLQQVGHRLHGVLRERDIIARLGGDEFAIVVPGVDQRTALKIAAKLHRALERPFNDDEHSLHVEASIGIAVASEHGTDAATLMRHADIAMYTAKRTKTASLVYHSDQDQHSPTHLALMGHLRRAIEQDQLALDYQPQAEMRTGCAEQVEALVRWHHPERGLISPNEFIPLAEQTGLIEPLTRWVLNEALRQCKAWRDAGMEIRVAVNLSARNLLHPHLPRVVGRLLRTHEVQPAWLELEITESAVMTDPLRALHTLTTLHEMGVRLSIDDFGTGYSSLDYLRRLPVDIIKIDRSFVLDMLHDESAAAIVRSTILLGHELTLQVVAEGAENQETWELLAEMGCDMAQGYYLSRPMPPLECEAWLRRRSRSTRSSSGEEARQNGGGRALWLHRP